MKEILKGSNLQSIAFLVFILLSLCEGLASESNLTVVKGSSVYLGQFDRNKECKGEEVQVFVVQNNNVTYQIPVPDGGNFQAHLNPGQYQVIGVDEGACFVKADIRILEPNKVYKGELRLEKLSPTNKSTYLKLLEMVFPTANASSGLCLSCMQMNYMNGVSPYGYQSVAGYPQSRFGYPTPYWGPFGQYSFNRFNSPCSMGTLYPGAYAILKEDFEKRPEQDQLHRAPATSLAPSSYFSGGCMAHSYPGTGGMVMGKPNLYFHAPEGQKVNIKIKHLENGNLLASSPVLPNEGLNLTVAKAGAFQIDNTKYSYLFYDFRTDSDYVQQRYGRCVEGREVVSSMVDYLQKAGFSAKEQKDFYSYWNVKLPKFPKVCIYPQLNNELSKLAHLEITPQPDRLTRIVFMLVPIIKNKWPRGYFSKAPEKDWNFKKYFAARELASEQGQSPEFEVREWGVGLLTVPEVLPSNEREKTKTQSINY